GFPALLEGTEVPALATAAHDPEATASSVEREAASDREGLDDLVRAERRVAEEACAVHLNLSWMAASNPLWLPAHHRVRAARVSRSEFAYGRHHAVVDRAQRRLRTRVQGVGGRHRISSCARRRTRGHLL